MEDDLRQSSRLDAFTKIVSRKLEAVTTREKEDLAREMVNEAERSPATHTLFQKAFALAQNREVPEEVPQGVGFGSLMGLLKPILKRNLRYGVVLAALRFFPKAYRYAAYFALLVVSIAVLYYFITVELKVRTYLSKNPDATRSAAKKAAKLEMSLGWSLRLLNYKLGANKSIVYLITGKHFPGKEVMGRFAQAIGYPVKSLKAWWKKVEIPFFHRLQTKAEDGTLTEAESPVYEALQEKLPE
jgi:hypothetical protein